MKYSPTEGTVSAGLQPTKEAGLSSLSMLLDKQLILICNYCLHGVACFLLKWLPCCARKGENAGVTFVSAKKQSHLPTVVKCNPWCIEFLFSNRNLSFLSGKSNFPPSVSQNIRKQNRCLFYLIKNMHMHCNNFELIFAGCQYLIMLILHL